MRTATAGFLLFLTWLVAIVAVPVNWIDRQLHSDAFAGTSRQILQDPEVRAVVKETIIDAYTQGGSVPPEAVAQFEGQVDAALASDAVADIWVTTTLAVREALLEGSGQTVDLSELVRVIAAELPPEVSGALNEVPEDLRNVELSGSSEIQTARDIAGAVKTGGILLPLAVLVLLGLAVLAARRRLVALAGGGFSIALGMLMLLIAIGVLVGRAVSEVGEAEGPIFEALLNLLAGSLRGQILMVLVAALVVGAGAVVGEVLLRRRSRSDGAAPTDPGEYAGYHPGGQPGAYANAYPGNDGFRPPPYPPAPGQQPAYPPTHAPPGHQPAPAGAGHYGPPMSPPGNPYARPAGGPPPPAQAPPGRTAPPPPPGPPTQPPSSDPGWTPR